ncbi:hypothetical protein TPHA_0C03610 [Tetrapisispora phaffii CBS 4417]|uniref:B30.2/SPRY domain-containing protein n=1 Tax=Tetrapisispora phaffii (strain ATCC 24235 / CBS 4417 / NBRC 1672 / NRRL Y-8282 / UCD 70-5) TaxID=1071381 RepID=G8BQK1_TETPH|nr:hypothetical protein TPHA_0C03610 [Tetrapisispora phaffii CBS 4417]CCE62513.1 hypothetical protein TPHA_0C03610 [Tetrapisispora phaffii CBS 4417]
MIIQSFDNQGIPLNNNQDKINYDGDDLDGDLIIYSFIIMLLTYLVLTGILLLVRFIFIRWHTTTGRLSLFPTFGELDLDLERDLNGAHSNIRRFRNQNNDQNSTYDNTSDHGNRTSKRKSKYSINEMNRRWPSVLFDENDNEIIFKTNNLPIEEQFYFRQGEEYIKSNPPLIIPYNHNYDVTGIDDNEDAIINEQTKIYIKEEGASAWTFVPDVNLPNDTVLITNKTEVEFLNYNYDASVQTNLPIPRLNRVYYCEFKIYEVNNSNQVNDFELRDGEVISFGLATSPYPYFRLPGRHHHSIAYDSTGARRFNDPFEMDSDLKNLFPKCQRGDVIGVGYRINSGTVFFTRNGKKVSEKEVGGHIKGWKFKYLYPIVGANVPCKIHVNLGTSGFVFIEANVKKWGFAKAHGLKLPPPSYNNYGNDTLLEGINDDDDNSQLHDESDESDYENEYRIQNDIFDENGDLLPPPPSFEYSVSPNHKSIVNGEPLTLDSYPTQPPDYSDYTESNGLLANFEHENEQGTSNEEEDDDDDLQEYDNDMEEYR